VTEPNRTPALHGADTAAPRRNWKRFALRIGGSMLVLALLFIFLPRDQLFAALSGFSRGIWLAGVSIYLCLHLIGVAKWRMLINAAGADLNFAQAARCYYYGLFGNTFLPSVIGGDFVRAGLAMKISRSRGAVLMGSIADRALDSLGLALLAGVGAWFVPFSLDENSKRVFWGFVVSVVALGVVAAALLFLMPARFFPFSLQRKLVRARLAGRSLLHHPVQMLIALGSVLILQSAQVVMNFWLGRLALIQSATLLMWLFVWPLAKLAAMVPVTQGGIGVREAAQGMLFVPLGVSIEKAVATGLIFQAIVISGNLASGGLAALIGKLSSASPGMAASGASVGRSPHQRAMAGGIVLGGLFFLVANTLAVASGTGSVSSAWVDWMATIPGFAASFAGSLVGFGYGAATGYVTVRLLDKLGIR